jgi:hypothetical protein
LYGNYLPIVILVIVTFTVIEAAGAAEEYPHLKERRCHGLINYNAIVWIGIVLIRIPKNDANPTGSGSITLL